MSGYKRFANWFIKTKKIIDYLSTDCFRRNTKNSVIDECKLTEIEDNIIWLKFTATERMMYNAYLANHNNTKDDIFLRKLCCHPKLPEETKLVIV